MMYKNEPRVSYQLETHMAGTMLMHTHTCHLKMICCAITMQSVIFLEGDTVDMGSHSLFWRREGRAGRRFVTEATLIHSSPCPLKSRSSYDRLNASRDVTFPQNLKRLLRALILSCLIVC